MTVQAAFVDYLSSHPISIEKVFSLPDHLGALRPLAIRCSMSRLNWPKLAQERFSSITSHQTRLFRVVFRPVSIVGVYVVDSLYFNGTNIEQEVFAGITKKVCNI